MTINNLQLPSIKSSIVCLLTVALTISCQTLKPTGKAAGNKSNKGYYEDLSAYRPSSKDLLSDNRDLKNTVEDKPNDKKMNNRGTRSGGITKDITKSLEEKMNSIAELSQEIDKVDGYAIQVYTGTNERQATMAKGRAADLMPEAKISYSYEALNFKVRVGKYFDRLEAQKDYATLKKSFPSAIIVMRKFTINR